VNPFTAIAIYLTLWWVTLFAVLPLGMRSHHEDGRPVPGGGEPGSPVVHNMKRKLWTTTWVSAVLFVVLLGVLRLVWPTAQPF
jgi:predicted secreted protein